jgi:AraC-like DNA-binding protein
MPMRRIEHVRHESALGRWESAVARPHPALQPYIREYVGGSEQTYQPFCRRELPTEIAPVVISFGAPFRMFDRTDPSKYVDLGSFATGAFDTYALVGSTGPYACVQIDFTVLGARVFLQQPLHALANREVPLDALLGREAARLEDELVEAPSWAARFDILDRVILARIARRGALPERVAYAWRRLVATNGQVGISVLARDTGWSHKHLIAQFTEQLGIPPKVMARVLRFGRAAELLKVSARGQLADIAYACGYYDQAHFTRDFRAFAGVTPSALLSSQLPNRGGFIV